MECVRLISYKFVKGAKAVIVKKNESSLIDYCRARLANFKVPKSVDFVTELPKSGVAKILKRKLREPYWKGQIKQVNYEKGGLRLKYKLGFLFFKNIWFHSLKIRLP